MGRNKEPVDFILAKGKKNLTKAEISERRNLEIAVPSDNIVPPDYLTQKQKKEFTDLAKQLVELKILTNLDDQALAQYIVAKDMYIRLSKKIRTPKVINDITTLNTMSRIHDRYYKECRTSASDLGLTITSRCKLVVPDPKPVAPPKENKFKKFDIV